MEKNIKVDKDYLEAFNLGYELAKELNLKSPMFQDLNSENSLNNAMQAGMTQYIDESKQGLEQNNSYKVIKNKDKGQGFNHAN